jgi:hypothetical protein
MNFHYFSPTSTLQHTVTINIVTNVLRSKGEEKESKQEYFFPTLGKAK